MRNIPLHDYSLWQDTYPWERQTGTPPGNATCLLTPETVNPRYARKRSLSLKQDC